MGMKRAFSLVELSIVLVILGLLVGGILAGQSLIRAAELRAAATEYQNFSTALNSFRDKYFAIPGDFNRATSFWPSTVNGDGNGLIGNSAAATTSAENFQLWNHLALAGLIAGQYSGLSGSCATCATVGTNIPTSRITNGGWFAWYWGTVGATSTQSFTLPADYGNSFALGAITATWPEGALLKPEEAWNIDTKIDDGKPAYGRIVARYWNNQCTTPNSGGASTTNLDASYYLANNALACALYFIRAY